MCDVWTFVRGVLERSKFWHSTSCAQHIHCHRCFPCDLLIQMLCCQRDFEKERAREERRVIERARERRRVIERERERDTESKRERERERERYTENKREREREGEMRERERERERER